MKKAMWLVLFGIVALGMAGIGQTAPLQVAAGDAAAAPVSATGVVQQVKLEEGRVEISHQEIPALGWPAMTMFFRVKDKALLGGIAAGDKVRFELEKDARGLAITRIEKMAK